MDGTRYDVMGEDVSKSLKRAAKLLNYPMTQGIPIARIDTHLLRSKGANALAYLDTQIQKMAQWKGVTFKEYMREELGCYSAGMSTSMKHTFKLINISRNAYHKVTAECIKADYNVNCAAAAQHHTCLTRKILLE